MTNRDSDTESKIKQLRKEYGSSFELNESLVRTDPIAQFSDWFDFAIQAGISEPNAMALATVDRQGMPSQRMVLLKQFSAQGFCFYTNYQSRKGLDLANNPHAALLFFWASLERQIRIEGVVQKLSRDENVAYFMSRPRGSQLGAAASRQSAVINGREELEREHERLSQESGDGGILCPEQWGGYRLSAHYFEFWQGRENRLHDRIAYQMIDGLWSIRRLSP